MELLEYRTNCSSRADKLYLVPIGDIHVGTKNCDIDKLKEIVKWIKDTPNAYWVGMGDFIEAINYTDKRFDPDNLDPYFRDKLSNLHIKQADYAIKLLEPIKNRCLGLLEGNHEETVRLKYHMNVIDYMAGHLETANLGYIAMVRWVLVRANTSQILRLYLHHGYGTSRSGLNNLQAVSKNFEADIYLMGHVHSKVCMDTDKLILTSNGDPRLLAKKRLFGITGTFYRTYMVDSKSYGEKRGYDPTPVGVLKITIEPFRTLREGGKCIELPPRIHISA